MQLKLYDLGLLELLQVKLIFENLKISWNSPQFQIWTFFFSSREFGAGNAKKDKEKARERIGASGSALLW